MPKSIKPSVSIIPLELRAMYAFLRFVVESNKSDSLFDECIDRYSFDGDEDYQKTKKTYLGNRFKKYVINPHDNRISIPFADVFRIEDKQAALVELNVWITALKKLVSESLSCKVFSASENELRFVLKDLLCAEAIIDVVQNRLFPKREQREEGEPFNGEALKELVLKCIGNGLWAREKREFTAFSPDPEDNKKVMLSSEELVYLTIQCFDDISVDDWYYVPIVKYSYYEDYFYKIIPNAHYGISLFTLFSSLVISSQDGERWWRRLNYRIDWSNYPEKKGTWLNYYFDNFYQRFEYCYNFDSFPTPTEPEDSNHTAEICHEDCNRLIDFLGRNIFKKVISQDSFEKWLDSTTSKTLDQIKVRITRLKKQGLNSVIHTYRLLCMETDYLIMNEDSLCGFFVNPDESLELEDKLKVFSSKLINIDLSDNYTNEYTEIVKANLSSLPALGKPSVNNCLVRSFLKSFISQNEEIKHLMKDAIEEMNLYKGNTSSSVKEDLTIDIDNSFNNNALDKLVSEGILIHEEDRYCLAGKGKAVELSRSLIINQIVKIKNGQEWDKQLGIIIDALLKQNIKSREDFKAEYKRTTSVIHNILQDELINQIYWEPFMALIKVNPIYFRGKKGKYVLIDRKTLTQNYTGSNNQVAEMFITIMDKYNQWERFRK